ncbi:MAG: flagellar motor switch protein FliM [Ilumatobacter sp.]|jgi:flagellar motor switch protein FliM
MTTAIDTSNVAVPPMEPRRPDEAGQKRLGRTRGEPRPFNFRHPSTMSREHIRTLQIVQETLARGLTTTLASTLRVVTQVSIKDISQLPYNEYINNVPNPALLTTLAMERLEGHALLQIPLSVAYIATELMLGGTGGPNQPKRAMTELEMALMRNIVELSLPVIETAFAPVVLLGPRVVRLESNPQFAQLVAPTDVVVVISFDLRIEDVSDVMTLCIPFSTLQPHLEASSAIAQLGALSADKLAQERARLHDHLVAAVVSATAMFRPALASTQQVVSLNVGDTLMLNHPVEMPLTLEVDGVAVHEVKIGRINRHFAVQVVDGVDPARARRLARLQIIRNRPT